MDRILIFAISVLLCASCASLPTDPDTPNNSNSRENTLVFDAGPSVTEPSHFNWYRVGADLNRGAVQVLLESMYYVDQSGSLVPWLAEAPPVANTDFTEFTIKLRSNVYWSQIERHEFDAGDVVFSARAVMKEPEFDSLPAKAIREKVAKVNALDSHTVKFTLKEPSPSFIVDYFSGKEGANFNFVPQHVWTTVPDLVGFQNPKPIGTGAYVLRNPETDPTHWERFDDWWAIHSLDDLPNPHYLEWQYFSRAEDRVRAMAHGELDSTPFLSVGLIDSLIRITDFVEPMKPMLAISNAYWIGWKQVPVEDIYEPTGSRILVHTLKANNKRKIRLE